MSMISIIKNPPTEAIVITCHAFHIALATTTKNKIKKNFIIQDAKCQILTRF